MRRIVKGQGDLMFLDRSGKRWTYERYAELYTRDIAGESYRDGQKEQFTHLGNDLVRISTNDTADSCTEDQGKIISLSGATEGFPTYSDIQGNGNHPFTYGCRHELLYVDPEEVKEYLAFL